MYSIQRSRCLAVAGCLAALVAAGPARAQTLQKIGVFDAQRVSEETRAGRRAQADLEALRAQKQGEIERREKEASDLDQQLKQQQRALAPERVTAMRLELRRKVLELEHFKELASRELQLELSAAEAQFNEKLAIVIEQFGRDEQFAVIYERGTLAWHSPSVDVTTAMIDLFDRMFPADSGS